MTTTSTAPPTSSSSKKGLKWIETTDEQRNRLTTTGKLPDKVTHEQMFRGYQPNSTRERMSIAMKNPLVPIGMVATVAALTLGIRANMKGDRFRQQMMMRYRVGFQGFTILMLVGGLAAAQYLSKGDDED